MPPLLPALGSIALNLALGIGASMLANALRPQRQQQTQTTTMSRGLSFELSVGETVPVSAVWGRGRTGGQLNFAQEYGATNEWIKLKIDCGRGWYDALEGMTADEKPITLSGSNDGELGRVIEQYRDASGTPRAWVKAYTGAPGQAADAGLIAAAPTRWGVNHRATATPYVIITLNYNADMFPNNSLPNFGFIWRGLRLYDWRKDSTMPGGAGAHRWNDQSTWEWTENPAVLCWNFRRGYWRNGLKLMGMGFSRYANDLAYFTALANLAEEDLYFAETGVTLQRFAFGREIGDDEEHLAVLRQFEESWCGSSFDRGGAYAPVPAAAQVAVLTLEDRHRVDGAPVNADKWGSLSAKKTAIHGTFADMSDAFVPTPYGSRISVDLETLVRGRKPQPFNQPYEHRIERAQMRAEIALRRNLFGAVRTETFSTIANPLEAGDPVMRNCEWGPTLMIVDSIEPGPDGLGKTVTMVAWSNTIVPDPGSGFIDLPPGPGPAPVAAERTLQVQMLNVEQHQRVTAGNEEPYARAMWSQITDPNCDQVMIRVWPDGEIEADTAEDFFAQAKLQSSKVFGPLKPLTTYRRKALVTRTDGRQTYWTSEGTFTTGPFIAAVTVAPNSITPEMLAQELRNERGHLMGGGAGSLMDRINELVRRQEEAAAAALLDQTNRVESYTLTKAQNRASLAAIAQTRRVLAEETKALAELIDEVAVEIAENLTAGGLFQVTAEVDLVNARAEILMKVRAAVADMFGQAALRLVAEANGSGGSIGYVDIMADRLRFIATNGDVVTIPFKIEAIGGIPMVVVQSMRFLDMRSLDGTTIVFDGNTGFFSLGAP